MNETTQKEIRTVPVSGPIIPFGKYKGQPVEAMAEDRKYLDWLTAQSWFRDQYQQIYTLVINNFQEPTDTPDHNRLHVKFLDNEFCLSVCNKAFRMTEPAVEWRRFEHLGYDVALGLNYIDVGVDPISRDKIAFGIEIKPTVSDDFPSILRSMKRLDIIESYPVEHIHEGKTFQMLAWPTNHIDILCLEKYIGQGASEEQFVSFMESENIKIVWI